ncbi:hypothetical protein GCM10010969_13370 [Saccharibacillus kuerlensis]|uniref:DUF2642 domain-containing protein n=1 Tax=Saccharibacillus kuerlensis TaxID=459527 RepID=A0ABQ2KXM9_9BACL|nr:hypothetical protein GCM10010969_13370 [Saccharibacillus kuerlensis]
MLITLDEALSCNSDVVIHTVCGGYFKGICVSLDNKLSFEVHNEDQITILPIWAIKRIHASSNSQ